MNLGVGGDHDVVALVDAYRELREAARETVAMFRTPNDLCWHCDEYPMPLDGPFAALAALLGDEE
jgi:hypothetical protein